MDYRQLGQSGIAVSAFGLGAMTFGGQTPVEDALRQLDMAWDAGITLFDTAENYPVPTGAQTQGNSERVLGQWLASRGHRGKAAIATKVTGPGNAAGDMSHIRGGGRRLDRANIRKACEDSLGRLGIETIDLYQLHWPDRPVTTLWRSRWSLVPDPPETVPLEDTLDVLGELVREGKVRAVGLCNETPWGVMRCLGHAAASGAPRPAAIQNGYSLLDRYFELGLAEVAMREGLGLIGYSPLARGSLSGATRPDARPLSPARAGAIAAYAALAREAGLDPAHMALAFAAGKPFMASVLMAASATGQLAHNLGAIGLTLPRDLVKAIDAIHDCHPNPK